MVIADVLTKRKSIYAAKDRADIVDAIKGVVYVIIHENPQANKLFRSISSS
jgi:glycerol-3-phosphate cytidylyltransferase-like family protein